MGTFVVRAGLTGLALWVVTKIVPGVTFVGGDTTLQRVGIIFVVALVFGLVNAFIKPVVQLLNQKIAKIVAEPAFQTKLRELGGIAPAGSNSTDAFAEVLARELAVLPKTAKAIGLQLD